MRICHRWVWPSGIEYTKLNRTLGLGQRLAGPAYRPHAPGKAAGSVLQALNFRPVETLSVV